jgi:periplasmic protein TonB
LMVVSGSDPFVRPTVDAVKQWKFRPYVVNGSPTPVATQISVHFTLSG